MKNVIYSPGTVRDLINALLPWGAKGRHRRGAIDEVRRARQDRDEEIPSDAAVQAAFNEHNRDSDVWRKKGENPKNALFYFPDRRRRRGWWAVDPEPAKEWLAERTFSSDIHFDEDGEAPEF